jgi:hypothetical protein
MHILKSDAKLHEIVRCLFLKVIQTTTKFILIVSTSIYHLIKLNYQPETWETSPWSFSYKAFIFFIKSCFLAYTNGELSYASEKRKKMEI